MTDPAFSMRQNHSVPAKSHRDWHPNSGTHAVHLITLGCPRVARQCRWSNTAATPLIGSRRLALLAYLATHGRAGVSRGELVQLLWPALEPSQARDTLDHALYVLGAQLGKPLIVHDDSVALDHTRCSVDVAAFDRALRGGDLEAAVGMYQGDFLDGFALPKAPAFERWAVRQREHFRQRQLAALEALARAARPSNPALAARWWSELAHLDPHDCHVVVECMKALSDAGNTATAIMRGRRHVHLVRRDLHHEPAREVDTLLAQLEREDTPLVGPTRR